MYKQADDMVQQEEEFQGEIEDMVIMNCIRGLKEEFEERLWDQNARFYDNDNLSWFEKIKEISSLRQELDAISKSLSLPEFGHISSHGSMEISEECNDNKRSDHLHRKVSGNHVLLLASLWDGNGKHDESVIAVPENLDNDDQLKHMTKEELVSYFKNEMTEMKRNHELKVQEMTEEYFSLQRECLSERRSSLPFKKDKEFDTLRKKIPEVILKLDDILLEIEKFDPFNKNGESLCSLKDRWESLLSDNRQLRGKITDKEKEAKRLSSQVSATAKIMSQHSVAKANLVKRIEHLQCALVDACTEASITEDVYKCLLRGVVNSNSSVTELSDIEPSSTHDLEDSAMESIIMQELCAVIFKESLKEAEEKLFKLMEEKEKAAAALVKEKEEFELVSQELNKLKNETSRQEMLISERSKESDVMKRELSVALEKIEGYELELCDLKHIFTLKMEEIRETDEERRRVLLSVTQEMQNSTRIADFECRVMEDITKNNMRLDNLSSQLRALIEKAEVIKGTGLMYKQTLERRSSDLQKAEAEVDLLGDQVDALSSLLEKIYIALDHYSPVLQHYPGIVETLKLVRRELGGESTKPA